jgi:hypothetical protein
VLGAIAADQRHPAVACSGRVSHVMRLLAWIARTMRPCIKGSCLHKAQRCAVRIAVVRRDGERDFVDELVTTSFGLTTQRYSIYRFGRDRCALGVDGSFVIVRTGERLRRVAAAGMAAFAR